MSRPGIYAILALVVVISCLLEYWAARFLSSLPGSKQKRVVGCSLALCALPLALFRTSIVTSDCFVLLTALVAGILLSRTVGSVGALVTMLLVAAVVDFISTQVGPSRWLVEQARQSRGVTVLRYLAVSIQLRGKIIPIIGVGDLMFFTVCVTTLRRMGWTGTKAFAAPVAGLLSALGVGLWAGFTPALPFVAAAVLLSAGLSRTLSHEPCRS